MLRAGPAVGVERDRLPEYLGIYRPNALFLESSHVLSSVERRLCATRFTLQETRRRRVYKKCKLGGRHRVEIGTVWVEKVTPNVT